MFTQEQIDAFNLIKSFAADPYEKIMVLSGAAGTGKSALVSKIIEEKNNIVTLANLAGIKNLNIVLTATTNKAVNALIEAILSKNTSEALKNFCIINPIKTTHSFFKLRVENNSVIYPKHVRMLGQNTLLIIDEASFVDQEFFNYLRQVTIQNECVKILFIGDQNQLATTHGTPPVFDISNIPSFYFAKLTKIFRQKNNELLTLSQTMRDYVETRNFGGILESQSVVWHDTEEEFFVDMMQKINSGKRIKALAYTNKTVQLINHAVTVERKGSIDFVPGDVLIANSAVVSTKGGLIYRTEQAVQISAAERTILNAYSLNEYSGDFTEENVEGQFVEVDGKSFFVPDDVTMLKKSLFYKTSKENHYSINLADFRYEYACTVHKSQGSTYDEVFIVVSDFAACRDPNTLARLLYVAVSRAENRIAFVGDIV